MGYWQEIFPVKLVRSWHRLPREAADSQPLEMFKGRLDGAIWPVEGIPAHGKRLDMDNFLDSNPSHSQILDLPFPASFISSWLTCSFSNHLLERQQLN